MFERIRTAHQRAEDSPGDPRAAVVDADLVTGAWRSGAFFRCLNNRSTSGDGSDAEASESSCEIDPKHHLEEASRLLEKAASAHRQNAPTLIAKKGLMYCSARSTDPCLSELRRSMSMQPNVVAGTGLATWHGNHDNPRKVREVCQKTLPHLTDRNTRYQFMKLCLAKSGASSPRGGLDWAPKKDREFFLEERKRRRRGRD